MPDRMGRTVGAPSPRKEGITWTTRTTFKVYPADTVYMPRTMAAIQPDTMEALKELRWRYRAASINDVIDLLISEAEPDIYHEFISEDDLEDCEE